MSACACAAPSRIRDCRGRLALMRGRRTLGRTTLPVIRAGASKVVTVKLARRPRRATRVAAVTGSPSPWGTTRTAVRTLRLRR